MIALLRTFSCKKMTSGKRESVSYQNPIEIDEHKKLASGNAEPYAR